MAGKSFVFKFANVEAHEREFSLIKDGERVAVEPKAFRVLLVLLRNPQKLISKQELLDCVWGDAAVTENSLARSVALLRKLLGDEVRTPRFIETVATVGYRFVCPVEVVEDPASSGTASDPVLELDVLTGPLASEPTSSPEKKDDSARSETGLRRPTLWTALVAILVVGGVLVVLWKATTPHLARYFNNRGVDEKRHGRLAEAILGYRRAIWLDSGYAVAHYNLADAYEEIPDYQKAQAEYQRAIDADLRFYPAYNNLSRLYILRVRDYGTAMRLLERALSLKPEEPAVQYSLHKNYGWANAELRNLPHAEHELRTALELNKEGGSAHCLLARVLDAEGKSSDAQSHWELCLAYSANQDVEPEWRAQAQERLERNQ